MFAKIAIISIVLALAATEDDFASRIVGGEIARLGDVPWIVRLGETSKPLCHGSLIREDLVLTSKSCSNIIKKKQIVYAYIGDGNSDRENIGSPSQKIQINKYGKKIGDLVILKLKTTADISKNVVKNVNVIQIATQDEEKEILSKRHTCYIAGWGKSAQKNGKNLKLDTRLQTLKISFTEKSKCKRVKGYRMKTELCYKVSEKEGPCDFDDGAPIACKNDAKEWVLVGVDTGKRAKNKNSKNLNVRCRGGLVAPIKVSVFYNDIQERIDDVSGDASTKKYPVDCSEAQKNSKCAGPEPCDLSVKMPYGYKEIKAKCDQTTDGGGWTVFQTRFNGEVDFYRKFKDFEFGFGSTSEEHWLGLKWISALTSNGNTEMRIDLTNAENQTAYQVFQDFGLSGARGYTLSVGPSTGTAGDSSGFEFDNGAQFSTYDNDQDLSDENLAEMFHTGWWLKNRAGSYVNLNGDYGVPGTINIEHSPPGGFTHLPWNDLKMLKASTMMVRKPRIL